MANTPQYVKKIWRKAAKDLKYFERHGIETDKKDVWKYTSDEDIKAIWKDPDLKKLNPDERIRKIASLMVFPTEMSRAQADKLKEASIALGNSMDFKQILKGEFDPESLSKIKEEKFKEYEPLYGPAQARKMAGQYISQTFFGSK